MKIDRKSLAVIFLIGVIILVLVLSSGLSALELKPGQFYYLQSDGDSSVGMITPDGFFNFGAAWRIIGLLTLWVVLPISIVYFMISPDARKQVFTRILSTSVSMFALIVVARWISSSGGCSTAQNAANLAAEQGSSDAVELIYSRPELPSFRYLGSFLMAVIIVILVYRIWRRFEASRPGKFEKFAEEAEHAIAEIRSGADLRDTIKRCYFEMSKALQEYRGIQRDVGMTPREFETSLDGMGLPIGNVRRLTQLFEEVRYGSKKLEEHIEREAIDLLNAIVQDCKTQGKRRKS